MKNVQIPALFFVATMALACSSDDNSSQSPDAGTEADAALPEADANIPTPDLEARGRWESQFGGLFEISNERWNGSTLVQFDNDTNEAIVQAPADDLYNPSLFSKEVWTEIADGSFFICTTAFGLESAQAAIDAQNTADASDPATSGCGGFSWTRLFTPIEIYGDWATNFTAEESIVTANWNGFEVIEFNNDENFAVTQDPSKGDFGKFNRLDWTEITDNSFYYCFVTFGEDTAEAAKNTENTVDATDPENSGCGGEFAWTKMVPAIELAGTYDTQFKAIETIETIDSFNWSGSFVVKYQNEMNFAITQNSDIVEFAPGKFNKLVWTEPSNGSAYYCTVDFAKDTAEEAENTSNTADASDLDGAGCGGSPWTKLTPTPDF